jgi:hypothetical protein
MADNEVVEAEEDDSSEVQSGVPRERELFELIATILLALAAVATAWAGFESAKWGGVQATNFSQAGASRTESVRFSTQAGQLTQLDVSTYINWLNAAVEDIRVGDIPEVEAGTRYEPTEGTPSGFFFVRMRDEFRPALDAWLDADPFDDPNAPPTPFAMPEYQLESAAQAEEFEDKADGLATEAGEANQISDNYVISAVLFATSLFFAAMASKLRSKRYQNAALGLAFLVFFGTLLYVLSLPIEI